MKMVRNVMVALAILASAASVKADSFVWFSTPNTTGNGPGGPGGAQGSRLDLTCDTSGPNGSCSWTITVAANLGTGGILGWTMDMITAPGNGVSAANGTAGAAFPTLASGGVGGSGAALLVGARGQNNAGQAAGNVTLMTFVLSRSFNSGDLSVADIRAGAGADATVVWANNTTGDYESVGFGPNAPAPAFEGTIGALPVIRITNVPEPTTLALLALGGIAALRRRAR